MLKNLKENKLFFLKNTILGNFKKINRLINYPIYAIAAAAPRFSFPVEILENIKNDLKDIADYTENFLTIKEVLTKKYGINYNELSHFNKKSSKSFSDIKIQANREGKQIKGKITFINKNENQNLLFFELNEQCFLDKDSVQELLDLKLTKKDIIILKEFLRLFSYHEARSNYNRKKVVIDSGFLNYIDNSFNISSEQKEILTNIFFIAVIHQIEEFSLGRELYDNKIDHQMLITYLKKHQSIVKQYYLLQEKYLLHLEMKKYHQQKNLSSKKQIVNKEAT